VYFYFDKTALEVFDFCEVELVHVLELMHSVFLS